MARISLVIGLCLVCLAASFVADAARVFNAGSKMNSVTGAEHHGKEFVTPVKNIFIQERASKQMPGPGQHFRFGALMDWSQVHAAMPPGSKLVFLIRHGQAVSNWLADALGPDTFFNVEEFCDYKLNDTDYEVFDAELTDLGVEQAKGLNSILDGGGSFQTLTAGKPARIVVSPLSRCLHTTDLVMGSLLGRISGVNVEEDIRETLGEDTCDARRSASDPVGKPHGAAKGPCKFDTGLRSKFANYEFPLRGYSCDKNGVCVADGFGLTSDADTMWTEKRESQRKQVKRATRFLETLFNHAPEDVIFVVTHSGFTRSVLLAVGREPYRPQNTELVPAIIQRVTQPPVDASETSEVLKSFEAVMDGPGWSDHDDLEGWTRHK